MGRESFFKKKFYSFFLTPLSLQAVIFPKQYTNIYKNTSIFALGIPTIRKNILKSYFIN